MVGHATGVEEKCVPTFPLTMHFSDLLLHLGNTKEIQKRLSKCSYVPKVLLTCALRVVLPENIACSKLAISVGLNTPLSAQKLKIFISLCFTYTRPNTELEGGL